MTSSPPTAGLGRGWPEGRGAAGRTGARVGELLHTASRKGAPGGAAHGSPSTRLTASGLWPPGSSGLLWSPGLGSDELRRRMSGLVGASAYALLILLDCLEAAHEVCHESCVQLVFGRTWGRRARIVEARFSILKVNGYSS